MYSMRMRGLPAFSWGGVGGFAHQSQCWRDIGIGLSLCVQLMPRGSGGVAIGAV